jgi:DNA polymerase-3 subunit beta
MKFTIKRKDLLEGVAKCNSVASRNTDVLILKNILLQTLDDGKIKLAASTREIGLAVECDAEVVEQGSITVFSKKFLQMLQAIEGDIVLIESNENCRITITCGTVVYNIYGTSAEDYPQVSSGIDDVDFHEMRAEVLAGMIAKTAHAMSNDETRTNLNGIFFELPENGTARVVATDGHRLAYADIEDNIPFTLEKGLIIPRNGVSEIKNVVKNGTECVMVCLRANTLVIKSENIILRVNSLDAEYPNYRRVIPSNNGANVKVNRSAILQSLKRMKVLSSENFNKVTIQIYPGQMMLKSVNPDVGEAEDEIETSCETVASVSFNVKYLLDAIEATEGETVSLEIRSNKQPVSIKPDESNNSLNIVMPLMV